MHGLRTLIVDDSSLMRKIAVRALRQAGFAIEEVLEAGQWFRGARRPASTEGRSGVERYEHAGYGWFGVYAPTRVGGERARRAGPHDHRRRQRVAGNGSDRLRGRRLHPQAFHARPDETACAALAGEDGMSGCSRMLPPGALRLAAAVHSET